VGLVGTVAAGFPFQLFHHFGVVVVAVVDAVACIVGVSKAGVVIKGKRNIGAEVAAVRGVVSEVDASIIVCVLNELDA